MINSTLDAEDAVSAIGDLLHELVTSPDQEISDFGYSGSISAVDMDSAQPLRRTSSIPSGFTAMIFIVVISPVTMGFLWPYAQPDGTLPLRAAVIVDSLIIALRVKKTITLSTIVVTDVHLEYNARLRKGDWLFQASCSVSSSATGLRDPAGVVKTFYDESIPVLPSWLTLRHIISEEGEDAHQGRPTD
ncbi:hypothetical protein MD484_g6230, partial [Candolleomyces efflorescens]